MVITNQTVKREKKRQKKATIDKLTNWYMINLAWGILGIVVLRFIESGYNSTNTLLMMPTLMKVLLGVFAAASIALFVCGKLLPIKNKSRMFNYGIFSAVLALVSAWIGFFPQIRSLFVKIFPSLYSVDSRWWVSWSIIILVALYLVVSLIWTSIRVASIEKGKTKK